MKNTHTDKEIKKFLNDLIGARIVDTDVIEFEFIRSPAESRSKYLSGSFFINSKQSIS